jgi:hypothetical protein
MKTKHRFDVAQLTHNLIMLERRRVRDTHITVEEVYRSLTWGGMTD